MNRVFLYKIGTILLHFLINPGINAQYNNSQQNLFKQIYSAAEAEYGIDLELVNGVHYERFYLPVLGHPYFLADSFMIGNVVYRGKQYSGLLLKYDIYNQELLVNYTLNDIEIPFYLPEEFISEFNIENRKFVKCSMAGEDRERIYQVLGEDFPVKIFYTWEKFRTRSYHLGSPSYEFSEGIKSSFLLISKRLVTYYSNRTFIRNFPKDYQRPIKTFIHENKIKVKYSRDSEIDSLIRYCNYILNPELH